MDVREVPVEGWERVLVARDGEYHCVVAIHSTALGTALGGTRLWRYGAESEALADALRLSRGMTYKNAMAGLAAGGGKSVMLMPERLADREALFLAHGRCVEMLGGAYITAEDVGTSPVDMDVVQRETRYVAGTSDGIGDPSPRTARGVFRAMQAAAAHRLGYPELRGVRVALQGCGNVGAALAVQLAEAGARLVVCDVDGARAKRVAAEAGGRAVAPDDIYDVEADVFAPCALGGILNAETIPRLRCAIVAGGANNQFREPADGARLAERGIVYVPDYVANAGGVITGFGELSGHPPEWGTARVDGIFDTVAEVLRRADRDGILPHVAADMIAEARIAAAVR
ncbi:MAG TPA: Glu/Leu/Phe/Val dehydrogenase dimerization domain-containing protein [Longimicrobium sp.]|nr:Glu/Leu/Phe/Val dehydrogenase dimerization domain-containing protein [Longimicrobium sp.]